MSLYTHLTSSLYRMPSQASHGSAYPFWEQLSSLLRWLKTSVNRLSFVVRINHLLQEVEQVDGHAHAEVDGVSRLDEVEGLDVRIKVFNLLLI